MKEPITLEEADKAILFWRGATLTFAWVAAAAVLIICGLPPVVVLGIAIVQIVCAIGLKRSAVRRRDALVRAGGVPRRQPDTLDLTPTARTIVDV